MLGMIASIHSASAQNNPVWKWSYYLLGIILNFIFLSFFYLSLFLKDFIHLLIWQRERDRAREQEKWQRERENPKQIALIIEPASGLHPKTPS